MAAVDSSMDFSFADASVDSSFDMENFDPQTEVLHCDKPGTGLVDAPRAFSMKLKRVTETENCA